MLGTSFPARETARRLANRHYQGEERRGLYYMENWKQPNVEGDYGVQPDENHLFTDQSGNISAFTTLATLP